MHSDNDSDVKKPKPSIGERTSVQLSICGFVLMLVIGAMYWAGNLQSKMDTLIAEVQSLRVANDKVIQLELKLVDLEARMKTIEQCRHQ